MMIPQHRGRYAGEIHSVRLTLILVIALSVTGCRAPRERVDAASGGELRSWTERAAIRTDAMLTSTAPPDVPTPSFPAGGMLTLEQAREIAVLENPDLHAARSRLEAARARVAEAYAAYLPTVSFKHTSTRTFLTPPSRPRLVTAIQNVQQIPTVPTDLLEGIPQIIRPFFEPLLGSSAVQLRPNSNPFSDHSTGFTVTWTIFDGFIRDAQYMASRHLRRAARQSLADVRRLLLRAVDTAYYQVQLAEEHLRIAQADETFSREQFEETEKLRAAGRATQSDVANFRVRMLAAQADVIAAIGLRDSGRVALAELMGKPDVDLSNDVRLEPLMLETADDLATPNVDDWIQRANANRPDLRRVASIVDSEQQNVRAIRGSFSPALGVSGSWGFDRTSNIHYSEDDQSSAGGIELRWDLYTGGSRHARLRAARAVFAEACARLTRLQLAVQAEVRQAIIDLTDAQAQIVLQRENLQTAEENRRIVQAAYLGGKETLTRLNEAQRDYIQADVGLALARIRLRQAWSDLRAAAAVYDEDDTIGP